MKNLYILTLSLLVSAASFAQEVEYEEAQYVGNYDISEFNENENYFQDHYLLGIKFTLEERGEVIALDLLGNNTGANVYMALYSDNNGVPNELLAISERGVVDMQDEVLSLAITPTLVEAGDYWIMAVYDEDGTHTYITTDRPENQIYYKSLTFGEAPHENASDFTMYTGRTYSYFMDVRPVKEEVVIEEEDIVVVEEVEEEETEEVEEVEETVVETPTVLTELLDIALYPNPAADHINVAGLESELNQVDLFDIAGNIIRTESVAAGIHRMDVSDLSRGTYFIRVNGEMTKKFIKS